MMTAPPTKTDEQEQSSLKAAATTSSRYDATAGAEDTSQSDEGVSEFELQAQTVVSRPSFPVVVVDDDTTTTSSPTAPPAPNRRKRGMDLLVDLNMKKQANSFVLAGSRSKTTAAHSCAEATTKNSHGSFCAFAGRHTRMQARGGDKHSGPINTCATAWSTSIQSGTSAGREGTRKLLVAILDEALAIVDDYLEGEEDSDLAM